ncbi:MAG: alpha/beta hydrolase [Anaerolineae bacterium]|nr:alpha/beta hydrolase [Anaerolineae bacterium]
MSYFTHDGIRLHYRAQGKGPLVLFLPGNTASSRHHEADLERLGGRFRAVAIDFRGTGQSDRLARWDDAWWEQGAGDAAALVEHLGGGPAAVIGTSGGGVIALLMAILHPTRVKAVVADSCVARHTPDLLRAEVAGREQLVRSGSVGFWQYGHGDDWEQVIRADSDMLLRFAVRGGDWFGDRLARITRPVLFTGSLQDSLIPGFGQQVIEMAQQVPDSQVYLTSTGDHPLIWSRADAFYRVVEPLLDLWR